MSFYTDVIMKSPKFMSTSKINDLDLLFPPFRAKVEALIAESVKKGQPFMVFETYRSQQRQTMLFNQHATELRTVGVHHFGLACDLVKNVGGEPSWKGDFNILGQMASDQKLVWGGNWGNSTIPHSFRDWDHVQFVNVSTQQSLFNLSWYPSVDYVPQLL